MTHISLVPLKGQIMTFIAHLALLWKYRRWDICFIISTDFKFDDVLTIRQTAKLKSLPNFPTIRYMTISLV